MKNNQLNLLLLVRNTKMSDSISTGRGFDSTSGRGQWASCSHLTPLCLCHQLLDRGV